MARSPGSQPPWGSDWPGSPGAAAPCRLPWELPGELSPARCGSHDRGQYGGGRRGLIGGARRAASHPPASRARCPPAAPAAMQSGKRGPGGGGREEVGAVVGGRPADGALSRGCAASGGTEPGLVYGRGASCLNPRPYASPLLSPLCRPSCGCERTGRPG